MDSVLVAEPVTALDSVVGVPAPIILCNVAESSVDTSLGSDGVTSGGEELSDASSFVTLLDEAKSGSKTGTTGSDHHSIIGMVNDVIRGSQGCLRLSDIRSLFGNHGKTFCIEKRSFVQAS
jgi:hypothetical protein